MNPYSLYSGTSSEREINLKAITPPSMKKHHSHNLPMCPIKIPRSSHRSFSHRYNSQMMPAMSKFRHNSSSNFLKVENYPQSKSSVLFIGKEATSDIGLIHSPLTGKGSTQDKEQTPKNVLIIDDNPFNLLVAKHLVEGLGYLVKTALNGQLGVELVKSMTEKNKKPFDVILMDLQMPVMDGYEATRVLKRMMSNEEIADIPIIALSANDSEDDKAKCRDVGMKDHLSKPLKEDQFKKILGEVADLDLTLGSLCEVD